ELKKIEIPVAAVWVHPAWDGNTDDGNDIAVATLASVAPFGASAYGIYTDAMAAANPEVGQPYLMVGYGYSGTGTSGQASAEAMQRMTITATAGQFFLRLGQVTGTTPLPFNASADQIEAALEHDFGPGVQARVKQAASGPFTGSFELIIDAPQP